MSYVITEWRVKTERDLGNELVSYGVDYSHVLVFQGGIRIIGVIWYSRVGDKDPVVDRIIFYSIWTI